MQILSLIWSFVLSVIPFIVTYVVRGLGFGLVTFTGTSLALDEAQSFMMAKFDGLTPALLSILSLAGVPLGISILFSAFAVSIGIRSAMGSTKSFWRKPGTPMKE